MLQFECLMNRLAFYLLNTIHLYQLLVITFADGRSYVINNNLINKAPVCRGTSVVLVHSSNDDTISEQMFVRIRKC